MVEAFERHRAEARERLRSTHALRPGPDSVSWRVHREIVVTAGWSRAVLLQLAHPLVAAAVEDHSTFRGGWKANIRRVRSTVEAFQSLVFGDDEEAISTAARINVIHDRVTGCLRSAAGAFPTGKRYSAHDASLLRWVHATLLESSLLAYERLVEPLGREARERYVSEAAVMEPLLDIPPGLLPRTTAELEAYVWDRLRSGKIAVTPCGRELARAVLFPRGWQLLWPLFRPMQLLTLGLLPETVRRAYGFKWTRGDERALARWTAALKWLRRRLSPSVREWPASRRPLRQLGLARPTELRQAR